MQRRRFTLYLLAILGGLPMALVSANMDPGDPPDFDPGPPPDYVPPPLGDVVVPPYNVDKPASPEINYGQKLRLRVVSSYGEGATYQWYKNDKPIEGATAAELTIDKIVAQDAGRYTIQISEGGQVVSAVESVFSLPPAGKLANFSTRAEARPGDDALISGFVVSGTGSKTLLLRAVGPTIGEAPYNVEGVANNPMMTVYKGATKLAEYLGWQTFGDQAALANATTASGAFALMPGRADSAAVREFGPGEYTIHVQGAGTGSGVVLVEMFDVSESGADAELVNISSRAVVGSGDAVAIPGIVVAGDEPRPVLVRAVGPSLESFGVNHFLADPKLTVFRGSASHGSNDDWTDFADQRELAAAVEMVGAFEFEDGSKDAAGVYLLEPGAYTVVVEGADGGTGVALIEVFNVGG